MKPRKLCVVTGTRADYGHLYWLLKDILSEPDLSLQLVVTGMHLSPEFGLTVNTIKDDGFPTDERVEMLLSSDTPVGICKSIGLAVSGFAETFQRLQPDLLVLYGDRFEMFAAAQAALVCRVPIAHLAGGETSEGAIDEAFRHAITKMASYHFVTAEPHRERVIQLGEDPSRVWTVGEPGLEHLKRTPLLSRAALEQELGFKLGSQNLLVTYHAATLSGEDPGASFLAILEALECFPDAHVIFTGSNADTNGRIIGSMIDVWVQRFPSRARFFSNLGQQRYLSLLRLVDAVVGNSSSGLIEAPTIGVPTVNVGERQKGRLRAASVIDCAPSTRAVEEAIRRALSAEFRCTARNQKPLFGSGTTCAQIKDLLKRVPLAGAVQKSFFTIPLPNRL